MKKVWLILALGLVLTGCAAEETFETVADVAVQTVLAEPREVLVDLPEESVLPAMESENGTLYMCKDYDVMVQVLESGDLQGTIRSVTGYSPEELTVMETAAGACARYDFVWTTAAEDGQQICRGAVLDDGSYHYVLTTMADADIVSEYREIWNGIFESFGLA